MKSLFLIGGPLIAILGFSLYSNLLTYGDQSPGMIHLGGAASGGTFAIVQEDKYLCDESGNNCTLVDSTTEFTEVSGLEIEGLLRDGSPPPSLARIAKPLERMVIEKALAVTDGDVAAAAVLLQIPVKELRNKMED